jgi:pimeloyl-ACP methyl ester carboxylesterase
MTLKPTLLPSSAGYNIAYHHTWGEGVGIMFCCGFRSDMASTKAAAIAEWCADNSVSFTRFDYNGHGASEGNFTDFTIGRAIADATMILDDVTSDDIILVGSSMGAWVALSVALERKHRVRGLITVAAAPDFTEKLMYARLTPEQRRELEDEGQIWAHSDYANNDYPITRNFIHEARKHLMLDDVIGLEMPIHLMHGQEDVDVPWETSVQLAEKIMGDEVTLTLIKDGDHRLNRPADLQILIDAIARMRQGL